MAQAAQGLFHGGVSGVRAAIGQGGVRRLGVSEEGSGFGAFQGGLGGLHALFEGIELALADALDAQAQCGLLADDELILRFVPLAAAVLGEGA